MRPHDIRFLILCMTGGLVGGIVVGFAIIGVLATLGVDI